MLLSLVGFLVGLRTSSRCKRDARLHFIIKEMKTVNKFLLFILKLALLVYSLQCSQKFQFFLSIVHNYKQLFDGVFVISRIIKVEVSVISQAKGRG